MFVCNHCKQKFNFSTLQEKGSHSRWCLENPKRSSYGKSVTQLNTPEALEKRKQKLKEAHAAGKYDEAYKKNVVTRIKNGNNKHSDETKKLLSEIALKSKHRRLVRSIRPYTTKSGETIMLDSSWEEELAKRLDDIDIIWVRPETPIEYIGVDNKIHNYFPDFYLPDYNLFLDPKNPEALKAQKEKVDILLSMLENLIIINSLEECKNFNIPESLRGRQNINS